MEQRDFRPLSEEEARRIFVQLVNAVHYCHTQKVVHMDIKLDNVMVDNKTGSVKLIDFGLCNFIEENGDIFTRKVGSEEYCAPELLEFNNSVTSYSGVKADVWCLGVVLYTLMCATFPYDLEVRVFFSVT